MAGVTDVISKLTANTNPWKPIPTNKPALIALPIFIPKKIPKIAMTNGNNVLAPMLIKP